ncbi:hypothetical protein KLP28_11410 [Nocardioidaceae bacterium]|nr:hypothetical protein KLP28_11410 [Nocardioidaceae bacterium]
MKSSRSRALPALGTLAALALSSLAYAAPATAAPGDTVTVNNEQQLRQAVFRANRGGPSTIKLRSNIRLNRDGNGGPFRGDLDINRNADVTILGQGKTINANGIDRHFDVSAGASLTIRRAILTNGAPGVGESGGAIRSAGDLDIRNSRILKNTVTGEGASGGAVFNDGGELLVSASRLNRNSAVRAGGAVELDGGTALIRNSRMAGNNAGTAPGNGGALHTTGDGQVTLVGSSARNNTAVEGGGLWNSDTGSLGLVRTEVQGNTATGSNAGDATDAGGGGIYNDGGTVVVGASQVLRNDATGTSASGGGILNKGTMEIESTTISDNSATRAGGGIEGAGGSSTDVLNSAVLNNAVATNPGNGGGVHLGGDAEATVVGSRVLGNTAGAEGGGLWNNTGTMTVESTVLRGNSAGGDAADNGGGGLYNNGGTMVVTNAVVEDNSATGTAGSGGGILNNAGTLTVTETTVESNEANRAGGGIEAADGTTEIRRSSLVGNSIATAAPGNGGGLHIGGAGTSLVARSLVQGNTAVEGGGLWNSGAGDMTVRNSEVSENVATGTNAADDPATEENEATTDAGGGGIYNDGGTMSVVSSDVLGNSASGASASGGGLLTNGGDVTVRNSLVDGNDATRAGGGIEIQGAADADTATLAVLGSDVTNNVTSNNPGNGGGIHLAGNATIELDEDTTITGNQAGDAVNPTNETEGGAGEGGGVWLSGNSDGGQLTVGGATICGNEPNDVYYNGDDVEIDDVNCDDTSEPADPGTDTPGAGPGLGDLLTPGGNATS